MLYKQWLEATDKSAFVSSAAERLNIDEESVVGTLIGECQMLRETEYLPMKQQLDMQYHDAVDGTTTWADYVTSVKTKYPMPIAQ